MNKSFFQKWIPLIVLSFALLIIVIDTTLLNVSLATIIRELKTDIQSMQWVISAYSLMLAAFTITGGRLGDIFGRKRMFMVGAILFAAGSFLASVSNSVGMLIIGESIIEGIGAALMMPATSSLIVANYKGRDRALAFGIWGGIAAAALAIGPVLGGYLTTNYSWRWGFRINVFVVIILLIGCIFIQESEDDRSKPTIDWIGIILSAIGLFLVVFGVIEASQYGWWFAQEVFVIHGFALPLLGNISISVFAYIWGFIFLLTFILWELKVEDSGKMPLVSFHLFQNKQFTAGLITQAIISLGQSGTIFSVALFLQSVNNLDALHTGLSLVPMAITLFIASPLSAYFSTKISPKVIIMTGLAINAVSIFYLREVLSPSATVWTVAPALALYGIGLGFIISQISNLTLSAVPIEEAGEASGINGTLRQVGQTLGSAIIGAVVLSVLSTTLVASIKTSTTIPSDIRDSLAQKVSAAHSDVEFGGIQQLASQYGNNPRLQADLNTYTNNAMTKANKDAFLLGIGFVILGFISASFLPATKKAQKTVNSPTVH